MTHGNQPPSAPPPPPPPYTPHGRGSGDGSSALVRTNGSAIAALVFGLMSLLLPGMLSIPAVVFGVLGKRAIKRSAGRERGVGMAISGIVLGILTLLMLVVLVVLGTFTGVGVSDHATSAALPAVSTLVA